YEYLYQQIDGEWYIANSADVTIRLKGYFDFNSNTVIKFEGDSDVYDLTLITDNGTEYIGEISYDSDKLEFIEVEHVTAIKIHFGRAVDTLSYGLLSIDTNSFNYINYTTPIYDFKKATDFKAEDYPENPDDYSINVIQIAESDKGCVYIYAYQPCFVTDKTKLATDINMSLTEQGVNNRLYSLNFVSSSGTIVKYIVNGIKVGTGDTRYYNISSIYRKWDNEIDGTTGNNNTGEKKSYTVAKLYKVTTGSDGQAEYYCAPSYVVQILNPYSDFLIYTSSVNPPKYIPSLAFAFQRYGTIDAHYLAFNTDIEIDRLKSATVIYNTRSATTECDQFFNKLSSSVKYGTEETKYAYPTYLDSFEKSGNIWNSGIKYSYSWDRIQTVDEFVSTENLSDETKTNLAGKQWVLRFAETERTLYIKSIFGYNQFTSNYTDVNKVSVLYLEYDSDGKTYKVGTVSDTVSDDNKSGNPQPQKTNFFKYVWNCIVKLFKGTANLAEKITAIIAICVCLLLLIMLLVIMPIVFPVLRPIFKGIGKGLWLVISAPFRLIAKLFKGNDNGKN
ncbi:MAG: hypothetical protein ACI4MS_01640, partial [Candidatus Coproplasma sp.]